MQSRRDQLQAYKFLTRRALAALVAGEPDLPEPPMRRLSVTTITGVMVAVLVAAVFAVIGLLQPGTGTKITSGTVYIERGTGARYVLLANNTLHPAANYSSAILAAEGGQQNQGKVPVKTVPSSVIAQKPLGPEIGIPGLPDSLPSSKSGLVTTPWTVCSTINPSPSQVDDYTVNVRVTVGGDGGAHLLGADDAAVVTTPENTSTNYLLWHGERFKITTGLATVVPNSGQPVDVGSSLLNALPQGPDLAAPTIPSAGQPGPPIDGKATVVGQLIKDNDGAEFVVLANGVAQVTNAMQFRLLQAVLLNGRPNIPMEVPSAEIDHLASSSTNAQQVLNQLFAGLPTEVPNVPSNPGDVGGLCVQDRGSGPMTLGYPSGSTAPTSTSSVRDSAQAPDADTVTVTAGKAALVEPNNGSATRYLVASGKRFSIAQADLAAFGLNVTPVTLPIQLLNVLPIGPAFDATDARVVATSQRSNQPAQ